MRDAALDVPARRVDNGAMPPIEGEFRGRIRASRGRLRDRAIWPRLAVLILVAVSIGWADPSLAGPEGILTATEAYALAKERRVTLIDLRSPEEWRETGIPDGALPITIHDRGGPPAFVAAVLASLGGDRSRPVALICAGGVRSEAARRLLLAEGFVNVYDVSEGVLGGFSGGGWRDQGLPMTPCPAC